MPNYIDDDTALPADRVDRRPVPPGESETKFHTATYSNSIKQFCEDARDAIQALQDAGGLTPTLTRLALTEILKTSAFTSLTLGTGPLDVDRASNTMAVSITPAAAGTTIRSFKPVGGSTNYGEWLLIYNAGNSVSPKDYLIKVNQDDGSGAYNHFHHGTRQPWMIIPPLTLSIFHLNSDDGKWHYIGPSDFSISPRPVDITTAVMSSGNVNDFAPTDVSTGMSHQFATWMKCQVVSGTRLCGFDAGNITAGSNTNRRIMLTNYSVNSGTIAHFNSSGGTSSYPFYCPNNTDFTWRPRATVWATYDGSAPGWFLDAV